MTAGKFLFIEDARIHFSTNPNASLEMNNGQATSSAAAREKRAYKNPDTQALPDQTAAEPKETFLEINVV